MYEISLTLGLILVSLLLFVTEWVRYDVVAVLTLLTLNLTGLLTLEESFSGFSNPAVVTVAGVLVMSRAVQNAGVIQTLGTLMAKWGKTPGQLTLLIMLSVGLISGFINDIGAAALLMPVVMMVSRRIGHPPSKFLIPLSYGCLLGGTITLIGTPPNILVTLIMAQHGIEPFKMFDFTSIGVLVLLAGILYMTLLGRHLLPERRGEANLMDRFQIRDYLTELAVCPESDLVGRRLEQIQPENDFNVLGIIRGKTTRMSPRPTERIRSGDILLVETNPAELTSLAQKLDLEILSEVQLEDSDLSSDKVEVVEAVIMPNSPLVDRNLSQMHFRRRFNLNVIAVSRKGNSVIKRLAFLPLNEGDVLLIQGDRQRIDTSLPALACLPLADRKISLEVGTHPFLVLGIFLTAVLAASVEWLHVAIAFSLGAFLMIITGCIRPREAYSAVEWPILVLMGGMIPLGTAMEKTGTASWVANTLIDTIGTSDAHLIMAILYLLVTALTGVLNNPSVAVIMTPIALDLSARLEVSPLPFLMVTAVAASCAFLSPVSHKANVLVWGPGGYRFTDYTRVGLPLALIVGLICVLVVPLLWPF